MAFSEIDLQRIKREVGGLCKKRSPAHLRDKLRTEYKIEGNSIILCEVRPQWDDPKIFREHSFAKITFVKSKNIWKLYWQRADLKFHRYDPKESANQLSDLITEIDTDTHGCFFG